MIKESYKKLLEKQHYAIIGNHSAVKICTWTKKSLRNNGACYKQQFYGIKSHICCQMSTTINYCDMDCVYCWRDHYNEEFTEIDEPKNLIDKAITAQKKLLEGFNGFDKVNREKFQESKNPLHFAISLTGETLYYPKLSELIKELKNRNLTSFIVTNGQLPAVLEKLEPPTQLYISLDAPNKQLQKRICNPKHKDSWDRLIKSLKILEELKQKTRTALRITLIKYLNMTRAEKYAELIKIAQPDFVEVKAYMFVGASTQRLTIENMPRHEEVKTFAKAIIKHCNYKITDEQIASRVVLLTNKKSKDKIIKF